MKSIVSSLFLATLAALPALAQAELPFVDGDVFQQGEFFINDVQTNCGEAQTVVANRAPLLIYERNDGREIVIDRSRFDPLPQGVRLFAYYQTCTGMFFLDDVAMADSYATDVGIREGWLSLMDMQAICETDLIPAEAWPGKPDAARCEQIYRVLRNP